MSTDGGRVFEPVTAPLLAVLSWPRPDALYGVGPDGRVHVSADAGGSWSALGETGGVPQAVTTGPDGVLYVAVDGVGIVQSDDAGRTFQQVYRLR